MPTWLIWTIVIVVVVLVVALALTMTRKRRTSTHRVRAQELRQQGELKGAGLTESHRHAEELRAKADLSKAEADRAEESAEAAEQGHQVEQAAYEDTLREADRLDPDVDTRAKDYQPDVWHDDSTDAGTGTDAASGSARHAADTPARRTD
ncbi:MAG TPA: hypothetical protein VHW64_14900 [Nocardioides sp.]|jgi:FtsZ-interacting cell division protein ZipA|uniref:hypothetical protein n=1 Tax=Nocardioides sp. TaxID=35761 RepID=UPI002E36CBBE|nr:hypothetical protein [Nocardioides sp.]HEX3931989.1 hypothetical protein [Nocardioides sp.]